MRVNSHTATLPCILHECEMTGRPTMRFLEALPNWWTNMATHWNAGAHLRTKLQRCHCTCVEKNAMVVVRWLKDHIISMMALPINRMTSLYWNNLQVAFSFLDLIMLNMRKYVTCEKFSLIAKYLVKAKGKQVLIQSHFHRFDSLIHWAEKK